MQQPSASLTARRQENRAAMEAAWRQADELAIARALLDQEEVEAITRPTVKSPKRKYNPYGAAASLASALGQAEVIVDTDDDDDEDAAGDEHDGEANEDGDAFRRAMADSFDEYYDHSPAALMSAFTAAAPVPTAAASSSSAAAAPVQAPAAAVTEEPAAKRAKHECGQCKKGINRFKRCTKSRKCDTVTCMDEGCLRRHADECIHLPDRTCKECGSGFRTKDKGRCGSGWAITCNAPQHVCKKAECITKHNAKFHRSIAAAAAAAASAPIVPAAASSSSTPAVVAAATVVQTTKKTGTCCVCIEKPVDAMVACDHVSMCMGCAGKINKCPICRVAYSNPRSLLKLRMDC